MRILGLSVLLGLLPLLAEADGVAWCNGCLPYAKEAQSLAAMGSCWTPAGLAQTSNLFAEEPGVIDRLMLFMARPQPPLFTPLPVSD